MLSVTLGKKIYPSQYNFFQFLIQRDKDFISVKYIQKILKNEGVI